MPSLERFDERAGLLDLSAAGGIEGEELFEPRQSVPGGLELGRQARPLGVQARQAPRRRDPRLYREQRRTGGDREADVGPGRGASGSVEHAVDR